MFSGNEIIKLIFIMRSRILEDKKHLNSEYSGSDNEEDKRKIQKFRINSRFRATFFFTHKQALIYLLRN